MLLLIVASGVIAGDLRAYFLLYPGFIILCDYITTQSFGIKEVNFIRVAMIVSAIPFVISPSNFAMNLAVRTILLAVTAFVLAMVARRSGHGATCGNFTD